LGETKKFREEHGDKGIVTLRREHIEKLMAATRTPSIALHFLLTLQALMSFAVRTGLRKDNPTIGIKRPGVSKSGGFYAWTEADIFRFEARHPVGTPARLAMALGLYTGQRRGDVISMGWQSVRNGAIHVKQQKTLTPLAIPIHPSLMVILGKTSKEAASVPAYSSWSPIHARLVQALVQGSLSIGRAPRGGELPRSEKGRSSEAG
jgi:integrase